ncbi:hypothetical protein [Bradyrhizobium canariense]|uniref:hypothetical protein n=1 Tax=Bradyrhizobium canariense TaxID=255045 RepID=UPI001CA5786C|nr:hypothetical protein [Bradyrhizobium canariense]
MNSSAEFNRIAKNEFLLSLSGHFRNVQRYIIRTIAGEIRWQCSIPSGKHAAVRQADEGSA